mgnify:CR=1 FL=1
MAHDGETQITDQLGAAAAATAEPQRRCIASGEVHPKPDLLRFVVGPDGTVVPDPAEKMPGRGIWCLPRRDMLEHARRRRRFARSARANVTMPADLADRAADMLRRRCLERIGLARRSGDVVGGFAKVRSLLAVDGAALLLHARDAAPDGRDKLTRLARARCRDLPVRALFTAAEQGGAIGRNEIVHMAVRPGGHAGVLRRDCARLAGLVATTDTATNERTQASAGAQ